MIKKVVNILFIVVILGFLGRYFGVDSYIINSIMGISTSGTTTSIQTTYIEKLADLDSKLNNVYSYYKNNTDNLCETQIRDINTSSTNNVSYSIFLEQIQEDTSKMLKSINCNIYNSTTNTVSVVINHSEVSKKINKEVSDFLGKYKNKGYTVQLIIQSDKDFVKNTTNLYTWSNNSITDIVFIIKTENKEEVLKDLYSQCLGLKSWYSKYYKTLRLSCSPTTLKDSTHYLQQKNELFSEWNKVIISNKNVQFLGIQDNSLGDTYLVLSDNLFDLLSTNKTDSLLESLLKYNLDNVTLYITMGQKQLKSIDWLSLSLQLRQNSKKIKLVVSNSINYDSTKQIDYHKQMTKVLQSFSGQLDQKDLEFLKYKYSSLYLEGKYLNNK